MKLSSESATLRATFGRDLSTMKSLSIRYTSLLAISIQLTASNIAISLDPASAPPLATTSAVSKDLTKVKHLFVAKLLIRRLAEVGMTAEQTKAFNRLSANLRTRIDKQRADVGITKEIIQRRDKVFAKLKKTDLEGDEFWITLQQQAGITAAQRDVFRSTREHYNKFRNDALKLLTEEQRARVPKAKRKR